MMSLKIASPLYMIYLLVISGALGKGWSVTYMQQNLCALKGSTVFMNGSYTYPTYFTVTKTFWLINPFEGKDTGLLNEADYSGRVEYLGDERNHFSLRLSDVRESDQNEYYFRIRANEDKWFGKPGVTLNVTDLQLIAPAEVTEGQSAILTCKTTCSLTHQTFIWYKNGHDLTTKTTKSNNVYLQPVSSEDSGSYSCAVRGYEHLRTPAKSLVVRYPPKNVSVSINPSGEIVEGSSVNLTCSSDANPDVKKYEWYKGAALVGREKTYTISKIIFKDSGQFKCSCSNEVGHQDSNSVTLNVLYPPRSVSVSISPTGEVVEGSSVTLTCSSDANPPVENYEWYKGTKSVGKVKSYTISSITSEDSGEYKCKSSNEVGHQNSSSITLNVLYTPKNVSVSISPTGEIVEGSSVTLTCSSDANPPVENYEWYKGTKSVGKVKSYTISSITSEDSGEYKCKSSNEVGHQNSSSITLNVLYPPKNVSVSISPTGEIVEGSSVTLTCSSDANPPVENYEWYKGTKSVGKVKSYTISSITSEDSGEYKCKSSNEVGHQNSSSITLNVLYPPKNVSVSISPTGEIVEGSSVTLTCSSDANPPVENYEWYKGTKSVGKVKSYTISSITSEDSGEYKCKSSNEVGHQNSSSITLNVLYPPKNVSVSISPTGEIVEGSSVTLTCSSDANPPVENYEWYKGTKSVGKVKSYTISSITSEDSGEYKCKSSNEVGHQNSSSITLNVLYPPKNVSVSISPTGEIVEGSSVTLTCSSDANPPVENYEWYKGTKSVGKVKSYTISSITSEDSGEYKCKSSNEVGHQNSSSITLNVLYPPRSVSVSISPTGEIVEGSSVTLTCSSDANPPVENYEWYKGTKSVGKAKSYTISSITSEDSGEYKCKSSNEVGHQNSSSITLNVLYPPKNVSVSISPTGEIVEGSSVTLTCSSDANPPVENYEWYKGTKSVGKVKSYTISSITSEDSGEYKCKSSNEVGHQNSSSITLNVLYPPKNVSVSISPTGEIVEDSSVTLTCSSDANPPVENYTWFKVNESSAVGSGQSYRALQSGQYYCETQNKHGSERSAAVPVTIHSDSLILYVSVGIGLFGLAALLSTLFWLRWRRQKKKADEGDHQNAGPSAKDDTYAALDLTGRTSDDVYHTLTAFKVNT